MAAFGAELVEIHRWLRQELADVREDVERYLDNRGGRPRELKAHCMAFCAALNKHHTGEDAGAFPLLAREFPELRPLLTKMEEDHHLVTGLLQQFERVLSGITADSNAAEVKRIRGELDGLTAILDSHFSFEERTIVTALNSLPTGHHSTTELFGLDAHGQG
ncbi:MAG: hemerythrin domain-containing protein [Pseudonocardiaceae bacterium]|nr:hemerythrin domain-containing protein [Pseudonocardiaceae bacterium]